MHLLGHTLLLFTLNLLDALLTIVWVRNGVATEGNGLMAAMLDLGDAPFLGAKLGIGIFTAIVLLRWGDRRLAKYGVSLALAVYGGLMGVHLLTGLTALGLVSYSVIDDLVFLLT